MALIIISLIVLVPLALLGWDLARTNKATRPHADGAGQRAQATSVAAPGRTS